MSLQIQKFENVSPAVVAALQDKIKNTAGTESTTADNGYVTVVHGSFTFTYIYNTDTKELIVQCLKKPLFIPAATILNGLAEEITELITSVNAS